MDVERLWKMGKESYCIVKEEINLEKMVEVFVKALNSLNYHVTAFSPPNTTFKIFFLNHTFVENLGEMPRMGQRGSFAINVPRNYDYLLF